jgi:hypothetical protein
MDADGRSEPRIDVAVIEPSEMPPEYPGLSIAPSSSVEQLPKPPPYSELFDDPSYANVFLPPPAYATVVAEPGSSDASAGARADGTGGGTLLRPTVRFSSRTNHRDGRVSLDLGSQRRVPTIVQPNHYRAATRRTHLHSHRSSGSGHWCFCLDILFVTILFLTNCPFFIVVSLLRSEPRSSVCRIIDSFRKNENEKLSPNINDRFTR